MERKKAAKIVVLAILVIVLAFVALLPSVGENQSKKADGYNGLIANAATGESGSVGNPITIGSVAEYIRIMNAINEKHIIPGQDTKYSDVGVYYKITNDLDFNNTSAGMIYEFNGHLDGDGHKISNMTTSITNKNTPYSNYALFGTVSSDATISNLVFENINISSNQADVLTMLALNNHGIIANIAATKINITASDGGTTSSAEVESSGFVWRNYGKILNIKFEMENIRVNSRRTAYAYGFAGVAGDLENVDLIFNGSTLKATSTSNYASGHVHGFAGSISSGENITISGTGTIESAASGGGRIYAIAGNVANVNNSNLDFSNITITGKNEMLVYGLQDAKNFTNNKITYGNINGSIINFYGFGRSIEGEIRRNVIIAKKPINLQSSADFYGFALNIEADSIIVDNSITYNNVSFANSKYDQHFYGFAEKISEGSVIKNNGIQYGGVSMLTSSPKNGIPDFFGFAKTANAKSINNNFLKMESISILMEAGYGERYWFIKEGNTEIHNNYVYAGGNETGVFIGSTIKSYFSAELTMNNKSDATIKKIYGTSSPDAGDIPIKVGDNLLTSLEKWVKKNGTFDNQYARWGVKDGSFPFLTYENPITELLYNGEILIGSADINNPTSVLINQDRTYTWVVYDWSTMEIQKDNQSVTVDNADGTYSYTCLPETITTYIVTAGTDQKNYVYFKIVIDKIFPIFNETRLQTNKDFVKTKYYEFNNKYYATYSEAYEQYKVNALAKYVETKQLNDANLFAEKLAPGEVVKVGTYFRYNKNGIYVCYFDYNNLLARIEADFNNEVKVAYAKFGQTMAESKLTENMFDTEVTTHNVSAYLLNDFSFTQNDSVKIEIAPLESEEYITAAFGTKLSTVIPTQGVYKVKETDDAGNVTKFNVYFDNEMQDIELAVKMYGGESTDKRYSVSELGGGVFYFETLNLKNILDADRQSIVVVTKSGKTAYYNVTEDELPKLTEKGEYSVEIFDRSGNQLKFKAQIGTETPKIDFNVRGGNLNIAIEQVTLREYKSIAISNNNIELTEDKNGVAIFKSNLNYTFENGGYYTVSIVDGFNRTLRYEFLFEKNLPKFISITGIKNDVAVGDVLLKYDVSKYTIEILLNGKEFQFDGSGTITIPNVSANNGEFTVYLKDINDEKFYSTLLFNVLVEENLPTLVGVTNGGQTGGEVRLTWVGDEYSATYSRESVYLGKYTNGTVIKENGYYAITARGKNGTTYNFTFTIKESLDYRIIVGGKYVTSLSKTNETVQFETAFPRENVIILSTITGKKIDYSWGDVISEEGKYSVQIISKTSTSTFNFEIDKTPPRGTLKGVSNNGQTNGKVSLSWAEEGVSAKLFKDGKLKETYTKDKEVNEDGKFVIELSDSAGNVTSFAFHIKRSIEITMNVINGGVSNVPVKLSSTEAEIEIEMNKDGKEFTQKINKAFEENGHYSFKVYDAYKNETQFDFYIVITPVKEFEYSLPQGYSFVEIYKDNNNFETGKSLNLIHDGKYECYYINDESRQKFSFNVEIDTIPPVVRLIGVENGGRTDGSVMVVSDDENVVLQATKGGADVKVELGKKISTDGEYSISAIDTAGNASLLNFGINYSVNGAGIAAIGVGGSGIGALILKILKKKKPQ